MADFRLQIITAQRAVFDEMVTALTLPGAEGYFGILAHHAPIMAVLGPGKMTIRRGSVEETVEIERGFLEMSNNVCSVLTDKVNGLEGLTGAVTGEKD